MYFSFARKSRRLNIKRGTRTDISRGLQSISEYKGMLTTFAFYETSSVLAEYHCGCIIQLSSQWFVRTVRSNQLYQISIVKLSSNGLSIAASEYIHMQRMDSCFFKNFFRFSRAFFVYISAWFLDQWFLDRLIANDRCWIHLDLWAKQFTHVFKNKLFDETFRSL